MRFRITLAILVTAIALAVMGASFVCGEGLNESGENLTISFWGDSIAEGILGASPINERESNCYYAIVGRTNGYTYYNRSVSGHKTENMLEYIQREDDGASMTNTVLRTSDIIHISILGNDLLQNSLGSLVVNYARGEHTRLDSLIANAYANFSEIIEYIRSVNPDAAILMSTVYNPMFVGSRIIGQDVVETLRNELGMDDAAIREMTNSMLGELNGVVFCYLEENPGAYTVVDVAAEFEKIYLEDEERNKDLFYSDGVHPSNEGHAVIAGAIQRTLEKLGLANEKSAYRNYKRLRCEQIDRLYFAGGNAYKLKNEIKACSTIEKITEVYFDETANLEADYLRTPEPDPDKEHLDKSVSLYLTSGCSVWGLPIGMALDKSSSRIVLYSDGTMTLEAYILPSIIDMLNKQFASGEMTLPDMDIQNAIVDPYASELFPGFDLSDPLDALNRLENTLGLSIIGLDPEHPGIAALLDTIATEGTLPDTLSLPSTLGVRYEGTYYIEEVFSPVTGETYTAIYTGEAGEGGQPYIVGTLESDENGKTKVSTRIEFLNFVIEAESR